ncbi:unnamed protein product [Moneuplotes crassus]|uniref:phosphatidate phosphatase n=1 Tax=Euplotes crassus TaxID=5936 RepID=A0AAD1XZU6_EUPCR|nr:unnamed protein product [Moneuplotes crassus]
MLKYITNLLAFNQATLSGCVDIVVIEQEDGTLVTSPFHVRFGKLKLLKSTQKEVSISINGKKSQLKMKIGKSGEAYFVKHVSENEKEEEKESMPKQISNLSNLKNSEDDLFKPSSPGVVHDGYEDLDFFGPKDKREVKSEWKKDSEDSEDLDEYNVTDSDDDSIEKTRSEEKYNQIIRKMTEDGGNKSKSLSDEKDNDNKGFDSPDKSNKNGSRFGWLWGNEDQDSNHRNHRRAKSTRKRSMTFSQEEEKGDIPIPTKYDSYHESKSEVGLVNPLFDEEKIKDLQNKTEDIDELDNDQKVPGMNNVSPNNKRGIFRKIFGLFRSKDKQEENPRDMFKLEKVKPKEADSPDLSPALMKSFKSEVGMSLCKNQLFVCEKDEVDQIFEQNEVSFEEFCERYEEIIEDTNLILRVRDQIYDWRTGAAIIMSELIFGRTLKSKTHDFQQKVESYAQKATKDDSAEEAKNSAEEGNQEEIKVEKESKILNEKNKSVPEFKKISKIRKTLSENPKDAMYLRKIDHHDFSDSDCDIEDDIEDQPGPSINEIKDIEIPLERALTTLEEKKAETKKKYKKTLFLTSEQLQQLDLNYGKNEITFTVDSGFQGLQSNTCRLFFWNHKVKIVLSDVDGTITKSDVLGHILPRLGKDWSHEGITKLYTDIKNNGYEFLYLTSRAIGMADSTRNYLQELEQEGSFRLPDGPCIMSPDRLMHSFKREIIDRKPQLFKIAALLNIKNLFKDNHSPFYAGFGNRETDAISYRAVGIDFKRIFIVNPQGEIVILKSMYKKSYPLINELVDQMFPSVCIATERAKENEENEDSKYYDLNYFKPQQYSEEDLIDQGS